MLSVLIPAYNYNVIDLVNEIHQQATECKIEFEIIVVDDFSSDKNLLQKNKKIEKLFACKFIENSKNIGRTATRDHLAQKANFDNLLFLDADVFPKNKTFISDFIKHLSENYDLIFGGIAYDKAQYLSENSLRWKFGKHREEKTVEERNKSIYLSVISGAILIKKGVFLKVNRFLNNCYGADVLFTQTLRKENSKVLHIQNEVYHLGIEDNVTFLKKTKKAIESLCFFEQEKLIPKNYSALQKAYQKLKKLKITSLYIFLFSSFKKLIDKNLISKRPSLFLFDLYKLDYFIHLKKSINA